MAESTDILEDLRDKIVALPSQVADMVRFELSTPGAAEDRGLPAITADVAEAVAELMPQIQPAESFEAPPLEVAEPGYSPFATTEPAPPQESFPAPQVEVAEPERFSPGGAGVGKSDSTSPLEAEAPSPDYQGFESVSIESPDYDLPQPGGEQGGEMMALLQEIASSLRGEGGESRGVPFNPPQGPQQIQWAHTWQPPQETWAGGSSPSLNVSSIAGTGGASSRKGYGTDPRGSRYWSAETDTGAPR